MRLADRVLLWGGAAVDERGQHGGAQGSRSGHAGRPGRRQGRRRTGRLGRQHLQVCWLSRCSYSDHRHAYCEPQLR